MYTLGGFIMPNLYEYQLTNIRVIDGDSVMADVDLGWHHYWTHTIRLDGVDCPETNIKDNERGMAAKQFTLGWFEYVARRKYWLVSTRYDSTEKYGRALGNIYRSGDNIGLVQALIAAGHVK